MLGISRYADILKQIFSDSAEAFRAVFNTDNIKSTLNYDALINHGDGTDANTCPYKKIKKRLQLQLPALTCEWLSLKCINKVN